MSSKLPVDPDILESYVLGLTNAEDTARIDALKNQSPEVMREILEIQSSLEKLSSTFRQTPRPGLKTEIWSAIQANVPNTSNQPTPSKPKIPPTNSTGSAASWFTTPFIAILGISLCSVVCSLYLYRSSSDLQSRLQSSEQELAELQSKNHNLEKDLVAATNELNFRNSPSTLAIPLVDAKKDNLVLARVYVNPNDTLRYISLTEAIRKEDKAHLVLWAAINNQGFVPVKVCDAQSTGKLMSVNSVPKSSDFLLSWEATPQPQAPSKSNVLAVSNKSILRSFNEKPRPKPDGFIAGEPNHRPLKRAGR